MLDLWQRMWAVDNDVGWAIVAFTVVVSKLSSWVWRAAWKRADRRS